MDLGILCALFGLLGLFFALGLFLSVKKQSSGNPTMVEISERIHRGAMVFLRKEYSILLIFVFVVFLLLFWKIGSWTALAYLVGAFCSMLAGFFGMSSATQANVRTLFL